MHSCMPLIARVALAMGLATDQGIRCSMSRKGDGWDNAARATRADLFDYIERFCNPRRQSRLDNVSPT